MSKIINRGIKIIQKATIDDIIKKIDDLQINEKDKIKVVSFLNEITEKKEKTNKRKAPKIPEEKQCTQLCKNGQKCKVAICDKKLKKCWAHMDKSEREKYRAAKSL